MSPSWLTEDILDQAMERADDVIGKAAPLLRMKYKTLQYRLGNLWGT